MTNSFQIVLTRKNLDSTNDDVIRVTVDSYDEFTVRYTDKTSKGSKFEMAFDWDALLEYFDSLKHMLSLDVAPFEDIQIQIPGFPVIALTPYLFGQEETHDIFVDIVERYVTQVTNKAKYVEPEDWVHDEDCCAHHGY
jgi:hypothetical protein